jgi:NADPH oxidase
LNAAVTASQRIIDENVVHETENGQNQTIENNVSSTSSVISEPTKRHKEVIIIKGPYSTCARYIFDSKHVVLICSGIGITPYASILSSLMAQFRASRRICKHCHKFNYTDNELWANCRLKTVDFIWTNRDSKSFEWFLNLLREFEKEQEEYLTLNQDERRFLNIQLYFTGVNGGKSIDNFFLHHLTNMWAEETGTDVFTGLRAPTRFGRPVWEELFQSLIPGDSSSTAGDIKVFFCGLKTMGKIIRQQCANFGICYYEEKF